MIGLFVPTLGNTVVADFAALGEMQAAVGGLVEVMAQPHADFWFNEEGVLHQLPANRYTTALAGFHIVGDVFITGPADGEGGSLDLRIDQIDAARAKIARMKAGI